MMADDSDKIHERLITYFTPRLKKLIVVQQVLDFLDFITPDQKERIKQTNTSHGNLAAAEALINAVVQTPHQAGWFRAFVDALERSGCRLAADYIQNKIPEPEVEADNDYCIRLIQLFSSSLVDMKTTEVCVHCLSQELITEDDRENVSICETREQRIHLHVYHFHIREKFHENRRRVYKLLGCAYADWPQDGRRVPWICGRLQSAALLCDCPNLYSQSDLCCLLLPDRSFDYKPRSQGGSPRTSGKNRERATRMVFQISFCSSWNRAQNTVHWADGMLSWLWQTRWLTSVQRDNVFNCPSILLYTSSMR